MKLSEQLRALALRAEEQEELQSHVSDDMSGRTMRAAERLARLTTENADLKARLKAARSIGAATQERAPAALLRHVTDLRVKAWRKP